MCAGRRLSTVNGGVEPEGHEVSAAERQIDGCAGRVAWPASVAVGVPVQAAADEVRGRRGREMKLMRSCRRARRRQRADGLRERARSAALHASGEAPLRQSLRMAVLANSRIEDAGIEDGRLLG